MSAAQRSLKHSALLALAALVLFGVALSSAARANATEHVESFGFSVSDAGGGPTEQAGGHPDQTSTSFVFGSHANSQGVVLPDEQPRNIKVDLPVGFVGSATATATCTGSQLVNVLCPDDSAVGVVRLEVPAVGFCSTCGQPPLSFPIYNMQAPPGMPAEFGFNAFNTTVVHLVAHVHSEPDYGISITSTNVPQGLAYTAVTTTFWGVPADPIHDPIRGSCLNFFGESTGICPSDEPVVRPLLTNPLACSSALTEVGSVNSWPNPDAFDVVSARNENSSGEAVGISGCDRPEFAPEIEARPTTNLGDSPSGLDVKIHIPQNEDPAGTASAQLKDATLSFPPGMTINPASAAGLEACSPSQVGLTTPVGQPAAHFDEAPVTCPNAAKLGKVQIDTPLLANPLQGAIYLATQNENPFNSLLALYIVVEDPATGVIIKLAGHPVADPQSGRLTVSFDQNPQLPFEDLKVELFPGSRGALKTPMTCGQFTTTSDLTPWTSPQGADRTPHDAFTISKGAGGSACLSSEAQAPNQPTFSAGTTNPTAGAYSPFVLKLSRSDGTQPLKAIDATLPKGLLGRLAGIPYCPDNALAAAAAASGRAEQAAPSCPAASLVGTVAVGAGAGSTPLYVSGKAYLAGPYKGAPLSLAIVTPAVAGPFDLGTVVVRSALNVDPVTTQIHVVSDPIPTILQGIPLDIRSIAVNIDRPSFTLNPTNCEQAQVGGAALSVFDQSASLSSPFAVGGCGALGFKPTLKLSLKGQTRRAGNPALTAVLKAPAGEANIASTTVLLPSSQFIDNRHINNPCTRVQFAEAAGNGSACPPKSILGTAKAYSPLLEAPLEGPVYFRSNGGERKLPDLVASLGGQIHVNLVGFVDSVKAGKEKTRVRTRFAEVPDAPVSRFELKLYGGKRGLLQNSKNLCKGFGPATVQMNGQNGKIADSESKIAVDCKHGGKRKHHRAKGNHRKHS
jgi:hypothetical protein